MQRLLAAVVLCLMFVCQMFAQTNVTTWHNDNWRTGANMTETTLTTTNVAMLTFGKVCSAATDGAIYGQPLIVTNVPFRLNGTTTNRDIAYVATQNDTLYAFDAKNCALLRSVSLVPNLLGCTPGVSCEQPVDCHYIGAGGCSTIAPTVGVLSTPVIDVTAGPNGNTGTIYLVAETQVGAGTNISVWKHRLHAIDITRLTEQLGSPALVKGTFQSIPFVSHQQIQRPGLLLVKNAGPNGDTMVYIGFSLMDGAPKVTGQKPYGWVFGFDTTNLKSQPAGLPYIFNVTPNGVGPNGPGGGIWQAGAGLSAGLGSASDPTTYIYFGTADGTFDAGSGGIDYADSFVKLNPQLHVAGFFTRYNEATYATANKDFGSGGVLLIPDNLYSNFPYVSVLAGKDGNVYVMDRGNPGGYNGVSNTNTETVPGQFPFFGTPAFWNGFLYDAIVGGSLKDWSLNNTCSPGPICLTTGMHNSGVKFVNGVTPAVSANGTTNGTGVVWAIETYDQVNGGNAAILYAFDALTLKELYDTTQCGTQDTPGLAVKFTVPTVANGKVYIGTQGELDVYGAISPARTCP